MMKTKVRDRLPAALLTLTLALVLALVPGLLTRPAAADNVAVAESYGECLYWKDGKQEWGHEPYYSIKEAWAAACKGTPIRLTTDWDTSSGQLEVPSNANVTLYLDGHTIDRHEPGGSRGRVFELFSNAHLTVYGADSSGSRGTLQNGYLYSNSSADKYRGGAFYVGKGAVLTMQDVRIYNCIADYDGGAIWEEPGSSVTLTRVEFDMCWAKNNGSVLYADRAGLYMEDCTVANCSRDNDNNGLIVANGSSSAYGGVTLKNVTVDGAAEKEIYGGTCVYVSNSDLTMTDCTLSNGHNSRNGEHYGGGLHAGNSTVSLENVEIRDCNSEYGGGIYLSSSTVTLKDVTIDGCYTTGSGYGGGIYAYDHVALTTENVTISNCTASKYGGGIFLTDNSTIDTTEGGLVVKNCSAGEEGGGIYPKNGPDEGISLVGVKIDSCQSEDGGGIFALNCKLTLTNCDIAYCQADNGGGIFASGDSEKTLTLSNTEVHSCFANGTGGGIRSAGPDMVLKDSSEVRSNSAKNGGGIRYGGGSCGIRDARVENNYASEWGGGIYYDCYRITLYEAASVQNNVAGKGGGGLYGDGDTLYIHTNLVRGNNAAAAGGGGLYVSSGTVIVEDGVTVTGNRTESGSGGGMYFSGGSLILRSNVTVTGNRAGGSGGGIYFGGSTFNMYTGARITENQAVGGDGGGLYFSGRSISLWDGSSITANTAGGNGGGMYIGSSPSIRLGSIVITANHCDGLYGGGVFAGSASVTVGGTLRVTGNTASDYADDLCMDGSLTIADDLSRGHSGMELMQDARIGISSSKNKSIKLGVADNGSDEFIDKASVFYCTDPEMWIGIKSWGYPDHSDILATSDTDYGNYSRWNFDSFAIEGQLYCSIDEKAATIHVTMPKGTDLSHLNVLIDGNPLSSYANNKYHQYDPYNSAGYDYKLGLDMLRAGDFTSTVAYTFQTHASCDWWNSYNGPSRTWYVTVDCEEADYEAYTVSSAGKKYYTTFEEAFSAANRLNCTMGLARDVKLDAALVVTGEVTLDLNGYTLDRGLTKENPQSGGLLFWVHNYLKVVDSSEEKTGVITGCSVSSMGNGSVFSVSEGARLTIEGGTFRGNYSRWGGVILSYGDKIVIMGGTFEDNSTDSNGGVVNLGSNNCTAVISGAVFRNNTAAAGGVLSMLSSRDCSVTITDSQFIGNRAVGSGGVIYVTTSYRMPGSLTIQNCTFTGNEAAIGGALCIVTDSSYNFTTKITNATFTGNHAGEKGGAVYLEKARADFSGTAIKGNTCGADRELQNNASNLYLENSSWFTSSVKEDCDIYVGADKITDAIGQSFSVTSGGLFGSDPKYCVVYNYEDNLLYLAEDTAPCSVTKFVIEGQVGDSEIDNYLRTIHVTMPYGTDLSNLKYPSMTVSAGWGAWFSGDGRNFTEPVTLYLGGANRRILYTVTVTAEDAPRYTVTAVGDGVSGGGSYFAGETVTITAPAQTDWWHPFEKWTTESEGVSFADETAATTTFVMPAHAVTVTANYQVVRNNIPKVNLLVDEPVAGEQLKMPKLDPDDEKYPNSRAVNLLSWQWQGTEGTMVSGNAACNSVHLLMVTLKVSNEAYELRADAEVTFNGQPALRFYSNGDGSYTACFALPKTGPDTVTNVYWYIGDTMTIRQGQTPSLPASVSIRTKFGTASAAQVKWTPEPAAAEKAGTITYTASLVLPEGVSNPDNLGAKTVKVTVKAPDPVGKITIGTATSADGTVTVTLSCATEGADMVYTVDGGSAEPYNGPFVLGEELRENGGSEVYVLRVTAKKSGFADRSAFETIAVNVTVPDYEISVTGGAVVSGAQPDGKVSRGSLVAIKAEVPDGNVFRGWTGSYVGDATGAAIELKFADAEAAATTFTMPNGNVTITADFVQMLTEAALTMEEPASGESLTLPDTARYGELDLPVSWTTQEDGDNVRCTASVTIPADLANDRYFVDTATASVNSSSDGVTVKVSDGSLTVTKTWTLTKPTGPFYTVTLYTVTLWSTSDGQGRELGAYPAGSAVTITAPEFDNYRFTMWMGVQGEQSGELNIAGLTAGVEPTVTFEMPEEDIGILVFYSPLLTKISFKIPAPQAGQPLAEYPSEVTMEFVDGTVLTETDEEELQIFPIIWYSLDNTEAGTVKTAVFGKQYVAVLFATEGQDGNITPMADSVAVEVNGQTAGDYDAANPAAGAYCVREKDALQVYQVFPAAPAEMTGLTDPADIHNVVPGTAYSDLALPEYVEVQTSCGTMLVPVTWQNTDGDTPTGEDSVDLTGELAYPAALDTGSFGSSVTLRVWLDGSIPMPEKVETPTAVPMGSSESGAEYENEVEVSLYCATPDAVIYYTTDGTEPTAQSTLYTGPITLTATTTIRAIAVKEDMTDSDTAEFTYTIYKTWAVYYSYEGTSYLNGRYREGETVTVTATDLPGKTFKSWIATGIDLTDAQTAAKKVTFTMPAGEVVFTPQYEADGTAITDLTVTLPRLSAGSTLPDQLPCVVKTPEGSLDWTVSVTWKEGDTELAAGAAVESGKTYTASFTLAGEQMSGYRFTGLPTVVVQRSTGDGSFERLETVSRRLNGARSVTVTFDCTAAKPRLLRVVGPADLSGLPNGTTLDSIRALLGSEVMLVTDEGEIQTGVNWTPDGSYDPADRAEQRFTLTGSFTVPDSVENPDGIGDTVTVTVTVSARGFVGAPIASVPAGAYTSAQTVELTSLTPGAAIYYTTDGTEPTAQSTRYTAPITLSTDTTLRAIAMKEGMTGSIVSTFAYTFYTPVVRPEKPSCPKDSTCPLAAFSDLTPTAWYHDGVHYALEKGLMNGFGGGIFAPDATFSRAMMVQVLFNLEGRPAAAGSSGFDDVPADAWYADAVNWAHSSGLAAGYGDAFGPNDAVTREQVAQFLFNYARFKGYDTTVRGDLSAFPDGGGTSGWAQTAMQWAVGAGVLKGSDEGKIAPDATATRAEVATMLLNFCTKVTK